MSKKKLIISVLCMALLFVMPVQAEEDICIHPIVDVSQKRHGYIQETDQHQEWWQEIIICKICDQMVSNNVEFKDWEDHNWKYLTSESGNPGQTVHDAVCTVCGYKDTVCTYP